MIYVLYDDDADGFGACYAAYLKFGDGATYIAVERGDNPPQMPDASEIFILDFNYPRAVMEGLAQTCPGLVLIDHHISAQIELQGLPYCHFDTSKSAAVLSWEYFQPNERVPAFFLYIQDADLWQWRLPFSRDIHYALESFDQDFATWDSISLVRSPRSPELELQALNLLSQEGAPIRRYVQVQIDRAVSGVRNAIFVTAPSPRISFDPEEAETGSDRHVVPAVNATMLQSEICNELLKRFPTCQFAAYYRDSNNGIRQWGLRSRDDFDVSVIATQFGGGGHPKAAGFMTFHDASYGVPVSPSPIAAMSSDALLVEKILKKDPQSVQYAAS